MLLYLAYSFTQAAPWPPEALGYPFVLLSADDVARAGLEGVLEFLGEWRSRAEPWPGVELLIDSGGYRGVSRGRLPDPETVLGVQEALVEEHGALPVLLDTPVPAPLRAGPGDYAAANEATARMSRLWQRRFGDRYVYPLHAGDPESLRRAVETLRRTHPTVEYVGLGSLAPLAARAPARVARVAAEARRLLGERRLHVFGAGNGLAAFLALTGLADSADTSSHLIDARYGMARDPRTMSMAVVAPRRGAGGRRRMDPRDVAAACPCPACRRDPGALASWGREGLVARAVHNAYWLLRAVTEPATARRLAGLRRSLARLLGEHGEAPWRFCVVPCSSRKSRDPHPLPAARRYTGPLHRLASCLASRLCGPRVLVLSGRYGLITPWDAVDYYDERLDPRSERLRSLVDRQLEEYGLKGQPATVIAGRDYYRLLASVHPQARRRWPGGRIGQALRRLREECDAAG